MLPEMKTADFRFWTSVLFWGIVGSIALKRRAGQVPQDAFSARRAFFRHTLVSGLILVTMVTSTVVFFTDW